MDGIAANAAGVALVAVAAPITLAAELVVVVAAAAAVTAAEDCVAG